MTLGLVGDVGGTNARFALADLTGVRATYTWPTRTLPTIPEVYSSLVAQQPEAPPSPDFVCLAVAAPVHGPSVRLTNADVTFDVGAMGTPRARLANDLEAAAAGVGAVPQEDRHVVIEGDGYPGRPMLVVGLGTGLGVAVRLPSGVLVSGEGGHAPFAPGSVEMADLGLQLAEALGRPVEWEDVICGRGFGRVLAWCRGDRATALTTDVRVLEAVATSARPDADEEAFTRFGRAVADLLRGLALTVCAGEVVLCGGVAGHLLSAFERTDFQERFQSHGPVSHLLADVPVTVISDDYLALRGCLRLAREWYPTAG